MTIPADQIEAVCDLLRAAMESDKHVFVYWSPHVEWVSVEAYPASTDYLPGVEREPLMEGRVRVGSSAVEFEADPLPALRDLTQRIRSV